MDDAGIALLNEQYRKKSRPTDVLSFPMQETGLPEIQPQLLGDIVISLETAGRQAQQHGVDLYEELAFLLTHGILHLLGYDHETSPGDKKRMFAKQKEIMQSLGFEG